MTTYRLDAPAAGGTFLMQQAYGLKGISWRCLGRVGRIEDAGPAVLVTVHGIRGRRVRTVRIMRALIAGLDLAVVARAETANP